LEILWNTVGSRLTGIDQSDIEHYHRIRNTIYHNGTGPSVDEQYLLAYRQIAAIILQGLFGVTPSPPKPAPTLEHLIVLWNRLEEQLKAKLEKSGIDRGHTFFWREAINKGVLDREDVSSLTELRLIRNTQVHSVTIDSKQVAVISAGNWFGSPSIMEGIAPQHTCAAEHLPSSVHTKESDGQHH
jgi:hypothetical protein